MEGNRERCVDSTVRRPRVALLLAASVAMAVAACGGADDAESGGDVVGSADAITAIVAWQAGEQEPVIGENGEPQLPVIFVVADDGSTIDVGVQAAVAGTTSEWATVRFADDVSDAFDPGLEGEPVRNEGVLLLLGPIPEPERQIEMSVVRYTAVDDNELLTLKITSDTTTDGTAPDSVPRVSITVVTQP